MIHIKYCSSVKLRSHDAIFHLIFNQLAQVSRLELIVEVVTRFNFTIYFQSINFFLILFLNSKKSLWRHDSHQRVNWKSQALQIFNWLLDFAFDFRLSGHMVRFKRKANLIRKSDEKLHRVAALKHLSKQAFYMFYIMYLLLHCHAPLEIISLPRAGMSCFRSWHSLSIL